MVSKFFSLLVFCLSAPLFGLFLHALWRYPRQTFGAWLWWLSVKPDRVASRDQKAAPTRREGYSSADAAREWHLVAL